jgi:hypothetical protein
MKVAPVTMPRRLQLTTRLSLPQLPKLRQLKTSVVWWV